MAVRLQLLGAPKLTPVGELLDLPLDRPASLGYYLAARGDWVRRSELAYLYHPEADETSALNNLRKLVFRLKQQGWAETLEAEPSRLRLRLPTDVQAFRTSLEKQNWAKALEFYGGTFLEGLSFPDLSGYEAWLELERQDLTRAWRTALLEHVRVLEAQSDWLLAERWLSKLLAADPLDEEAVQSRMRVMCSAGKSAQVQEVFERFRRSLKAELGVEPLESTRVLADGLRNPQTTAAPAQHHPRHNLPAANTRFVGRGREIRALARQLANPDCRLLTVVGLGGMGKTRLALELASQQIARFPEGVWLVALAGAASPDQLVSSIASALSFTFAGPTDPKLQLLNYLRGKALLLLLDNFEHLLEGAPLLEELLSQAPGLKLLVTSRVALELPGEWLFDLEGLSYPPPQTEEDLDGFDAVRLFIAQAERLSNRFVLTPAALEAIAELTRRVQGMPLALELLATWVRGLSVNEILTQLGRSFELLQTPRRDLPERHRSLEAILDYSWRLLSEAEQGVLARLSVFRGSFTLEAAQAVAGAHLGLLLRFINQSLVQRGEDGRYAMHELVRQFAGAKLEGLGKLEEMLEGYLHYYQSYAQAVASQLHGAGQIYWRAQLRAEEQNLAHALAWGFERFPIEAVTLVSLLGDYWHARSQYAQGHYWLGRAMDHLEGAADIVKAKVHVEWLRIALIRGEFAAVSALESTLFNLCTKARDALLQAELYNQLGWRAMVQRQFDKAKDLLETGLGLLGNDDNSRVKNHLLRNLAQVLSFQKDTNGAVKLGQQALELAQQRSDLQLQVLTLIMLAAHHLITAEYTQSMVLSKQALEIAQRLEHTPSLAVIQGNLGYAQWQLGEYVEGERAYRQHIVLVYEQGSLINFYENAFELAQFWNHLGFVEDAVQLWGAAEQVRTTQGYAIFDGYEQIKQKVLGAVEDPRREELLMAGRSKSPQELMQFLRWAARS